jgi:hypothetical protein
LKLLRYLYLIQTISALPPNIFIGITDICPKEFIIFFRGVALASSKQNQLLCRAQSTGQTHRPPFPGKPQIVKRSRCMGLE